MKVIKLVSCLFLVALVWFGCKHKVPTIKPLLQDITESVYASGVIKSTNQYEVYATVSGLLESVYVGEGEPILKGEKLIFITNEANKLNRQNAELNASFNKITANQDKLKEAQLAIAFAKNKYETDSSLLYRQKNLYSQNIGSQFDLEQIQLAFDNSKTNYQLAITRYNTLKKQLAFAQEQSEKNLQISAKLENDYFVKSEIDGVVYKLLRKKGELVTPQTPLAIVGSANNFMIELQVDEFDIVKVKTNQKVSLQLDSYKGKTFEAVISKINPIMNERTKTFTVEAVFVKQPEVLYPNLTVEANIIIQTKTNALTLPRVAVNNNLVIKANGDTVRVTTGLKDYERIEIIEGIKPSDEVLNFNL